MKSNSFTIHSPGINSIVKSVLFWTVFILIIFITGSFIRILFQTNWHQFNYGIAGTASALFTTWQFLKNEKKSFKEIGLVWENKTALRFFIGFIIGTVLIVFILSVLLIFTNLEIEKNKTPIATSAFIGYLAFIPLSLMEEIAFRSYPFLKLNKTVGLRITQIIVAIAFALYHFISGWSVQSAFLGPGIWAFVFGLAAVWSGGIAVPLGIHVALNILQSITGMRGNENSFWILKYAEGTPENLIAKTDTVGLATQLIVFICAVALTEFYIRKKKIRV